MSRSAETSVDPQTGELLEKILIELPPDHWSGHTGERVWAKPLDDDTERERILKEVTRRGATFENADVTMMHWISNRT